MPASPDAYYFAFDLETGGLDAQKHDILSYAFIILSADLTEIARVQRFFNPSRPVDAQAAAVNGYSPAAWAAKGAVPISMLATWLQHDLETHVPDGTKLAPLGHNVTFDLGFLRAAVPRKLLSKYLDYHHLDTLAAARTLDDAWGCKDGSYKLTALCARWGVSLSEADAHDALNDVAACVQLYAKMRDAVRAGAPVPTPAPAAPSKTSFFVKEGSAYVFARGKHAGLTIEAVQEISPGYISWVLTEVALSDDERAALKACRA